MRQRDRGEHDDAKQKRDDQTHQESETEALPPLEAHPVPGLRCPHLCHGHACLTPFGYPDALWERKTCERLCKNGHRTECNPNEPSQRIRSLGGVRAASMQAARASMSLYSPGRDAL